MAAAADWLSSGKDASFLASGTRLAQFEALAAEPTLALNVTETAYVEASMPEREAQRNEDEARRQRELALARQAAQSAQEAAASQRRASNRMRHLVAGLLLFLIAATGLSIFALQSRNEALDSFNLSESERLAAESASVFQRGDSPELAALLAIRGLQAQYSPQADAALQKASRPYYGERVFHTSSRVSAVALSADGRYALTGSDAETELWDLQTGAQLQKFAVNASGLAFVTFSPDGRYVVIGSL